MWIFFVLFCLASVVDSKEGILPYRETRFFAACMMTINFQTFSCVLHMRFSHLMPAYCVFLFILGPHTLQLCFVAARGRTEFR